MNLSLINGAAFDAMTPWLPAIDAIIKSTALLALTAVASLLLRRASAATRHMVWTLGLLGALVLPVVSLAVPRWQVPVVKVAGSEPALGAGRSALDNPAPNAVEMIQPHAAPANAGVSSSALAANTGSATEIQTPAPNAQRPARSAERPAPNAQRPTPAAQRAASAPGATAARPVPLSWQSAVLTVWAAGAIAILVRLTVGLLAVQWLSRRTERVTDAPWLPLAQRLAAAVGVPSSLTFLRSPRATMPMAWGILRPSVLMPEDADEWPADRLRIVLLHELAHVKRRDCLTHALAQIACAAYWFNPLVWIAARHLRAERERACDDLVLAAGTRGSDYAAQLIEVARVMRSGRFPALLTGATLAMAHRSQLEGRLIAILDPRVPRSGISRLRTISTTALVACALIPLASLQPWAYAELKQPIERQPLPQTAPAPAPAPSPHSAIPQPTPRPVVSESGASTRALEATPGIDVKLQDVVQGALQGAAQGAIQGIQAAIENAPNREQGEQGEQRRTASKADPRTVAALTAALKDPDREVRETAMHALVQLRDPSIFEPLVQALKDASPDVRERAARGLGDLRDARAVAPLTAALKDENASVREGAVFSLGQLRAQNSAAAITQALQDQSPSVREQAAFALGQLREAQAVDPLIQALKDTNASVREQAAFALGQLRDKRAVPGLTTALTDSSPSVREQAVFALGQLRDPAAVDALIIAMRDAKADVRQQAAFALGQIRDAKAVDALIPALKDTDAEVRGQAVFALGQLRDRRAVDALMAAIKDSSAEVRGQVAFALGQLRDPRAIDALTAALKDTSSEVRQQAAFALGQLAR
jgi:HEAT repeat protein/beta-lactamase regulating signal transducer with metallopeptidase domain